MITPTHPQISVLIPARNAAQCIGRCLESLLRQRWPHTLRIVVIANGCSDETEPVAASFAERFRSLGRELLVLSLAEAGKWRALNSGDRLALRHGPRIYLDADTALSPDAVESIYNTLSEGDVAFCALPARFAPQRSRWSRSYWTVWANLPYVTQGVGCGVYGVSEKARRAWGMFPPIHSDDKFVRLVLAGQPQAIAPRAWIVVERADGLLPVLRTRVRWSRGNIELRRAFPGLDSGSIGRYRGIPRVASTVRLWPYLPAFLLIHMAGTFWAWIATLGRGARRTPETFSAALSRPLAR